MKPQNVLEHRHYFAFEDDEENGDGVRFDACNTRDDGAGVWSPQSGKWWPQKSYERAQNVAKNMSEFYAEMNPR